MENQRIVKRWGVTRILNPESGKRYSERYRDGKLLCDGWSVQKGAPCRAFAMKEKKKCKNHGGKALSGFKSKRYKHGLYSDAPACLNHWRGIFLRMRDVEIKHTLKEESQRLGRRLTTEEAEKVIDRVPRDPKKLLELFGGDLLVLYSVDMERRKRRVAKYLEFLAK